MGVQEVIWDKWVTVRAGNYVCLWKIKNENNRFRTGIFVHHRIVSAFRRVDFVSDSMPYIVLRGR